MRTTLATAILLGLAACWGSTPLPEGAPATPTIAGTTASLKVCTPQAPEYEASTIGLAPGVAPGACTLARVVRNRDGRPEELTTYAREQGEVRVRAGGRLIHGYRFDDGGRLAEHSAYDASGEVRQRDRWTFDAAGHLLEEELWNRSLGYYGGEPRESTYRVRQLWVGGRLVGRERTGTGQTRTAYHWSYDAGGRMREARLTSGPSETLVARTTWRYDDRGRPAAVVRELEGQVMERATWTWDGAGRLRARDIWVAGAHQGVTLGLDDFESRPGGYAIYGGSVGWADASPRPRGDCTVPPTSIGHGYPVAEDAYRPQWPEESAPPAASVYGYNEYYSYYGGYGYYGGNASWYGHFGAQASSPYQLVGEGELRFELAYDETGRLTSERVVRDPDEEVVLVRERASGTGGVTRDTLHYLAGAAAGTRRELRIRREGGRPVSRELTKEGALVEYFAWTRDTAGRVVELDAWLQQRAAPPSAPAAEGTAPEHALHVARAHDGNGRVASERIEPQAPAEPSTRRFGYDDAGRITETTTWRGEYVDRQVVRWDGGGREIFRGSGNRADGGDEALTQVTTTTYDPHGLPQRRERHWSGAYGAGSDIETLEYDCGS